MILIISYNIYSQSSSYKTAMTSKSKPLYEYFNQLRYSRHRDKLATIEQDRPPQLRSSLNLEEFHKLRSQTYYQQQHENFINQQNQQLLQKLLSISKRRKSQYSQVAVAQRITTFNNPARKKRQKMITDMNEQMAERMLNKQSDLDHRQMQRSMEQYEQIKKLMTNNKRALSLSIAPLPTLAPKKTEQKAKANLPQKKKILFQQTTEQC